MKKKLEIIALIQGITFAFGDRLKNVTNSGLQTEVWVSDIQENLFMQSDFIPYSKDHSSYVVNKTVHVPQAGTKPSVTIDRTVLPAVITQRTDTDYTYDLNEYSTDPILITNVDELQVSYDKRNEVIGEHIAQLSETIGNYCAYKWSVNDSTRIVKTSGAAVATALAPGATGTRNAVALVDISALAAKLDADNVPRIGRKLLMQSDMFWQLFTISEVVRASYNGFQVNALATGVVAQLFGFDIMIRPTVTVWSSAFAIKAPGAATATTDEIGCLAWHPMYVARALGAISLFSDSGDNGMGKPEYYGILLSALVMFGAKQLRADFKGVVTLVQQ